MVDNINTQTGTNKQLYTQNPTTTTSTGEKKQIHVSRELDGVNNTGIIGEMLTKGTGAAQLAETNKMFMDPKFKIQGLLSELSSGLQTTANITGEGLLCANDMYVAGDPLVGGKDNNYAPVEVKPSPGFYSMFQDGVATGRQTIVNSNVEAINDQGNTAFTDYGFVVYDDNRNKYAATLSGGELIVTKPDGTQQKLVAPNDKLTIGDPADPVAKFYYADMPGGENGTNEKRLVFESYEKPSAANVASLVSKGVSEDAAKALRSTTQATFGFRVPDGQGNTYRMSSGTGTGAALDSSNGVKTYYDAHFSEGKCQYIEGCDVPPPPVAQEECARIWGDPHVNVADSKDRTRDSYLFSETGMYNIIKDKDVNLNANMIAGGGATTVINQTGFTGVNKTLTTSADGKTMVAGVGGNGAATELTNGQTVDLGGGSTATKSGANKIIQTPEYKITISPGTWSGPNYLNVEINSKSGGVFSDRQMPTGLLGETFDADDIEERAPKNAVASYKVTSLLNTTNTPVMQVALAADKTAADQLAANKAAADKAAADKAKAAAATTTKTTTTTAATTATNTTATNNTTTTAAADKATSAAVKAAARAKEKAAKAAAKAAARAAKKKK